MKLFESITYYFGVYKHFIGKRLYIVFALTAAAAITEAFGITLILPLIEAADAGDGGLERGGRAVQFLYATLELIGIQDSVVGILIFIGAIFIGKGFLKFVEGGYASYLRAQLMKEIKGKMFNAYRFMDYRYYADNNTGHFINVINGQINNFIRTFDTFTRFLTMIIITASYLSIAFLLAWKFALMAIAVGFVLLFLFRYLNKYVQDLSRKTSKEESLLNKFLVQTIQSFKYLSSTNQMQYLKGGVMSSIKRLAFYMFRQGAASAFTKAIREPVSVIFLLFVIIAQVVVFDSPIAPIFVALLLFHRGMQHMIGIQDDWQKTMEKIGSLEMVVNEFEVLEKHREESGERPIGKLREGIELHNVSFRYENKDEDVLKSINIRIPINNMIAVVGESGAGKSTLIDTLTLLLKPQGGKIYIDGIDSSEIEVGSWRSQIGYVSQETVVFDDTVANNICLWKGDYENDPDVKERVEEAAKRAYADEFIREMSDGYQTVVGDRGVRLSGGQRQRLFIARELYKNPNLLILDEATSSLDTESERYIQKSIDALKGSITVVIIAHRLSTIKNSDLIYVLEKGEIIESGTYDELSLNSESKFSQMVAIQSL
ncbi:ABC transporter ATP-binding protein [Rhodohalobacter sulfatireducens]|uniref:ABC transporter ATP-binding protein/permease n=1 Tax=Rhodohalobacter sulfatireducens TaxID=2911366 RepID=A0ABS9KHU2_9BACT|nr:ABC transporter ATP-binding protein [Rhodohalobacter sulfatireducens]MCG2590426.1 ABC transporter ATP-binding protein/permease [Rhodohalobacter sulfatireducens]